MNADAKKYLFLVGLHLLLGAVASQAHFVIKILSTVIFVLGFYIIAKNRNRNNEVLYVAAYIVGNEVFLRMTGANVLYEFGKYATIIFILLGAFFSGFSKNGTPYWFFLILLIPGIIIATQTLGHTVEMRKIISFNISGPVCLGISALYCYQRQITMKQMQGILLCMGLPVLSIVSYLSIITPDLRMLNSTGSNFLTSGGFGPNQVSTILGLGMFIFFSRALFNSPSKLMIALNLFLTVNLAFRGLITFSRGGMITGMIMICLLMAITYLRVNKGAKSKMRVAVFLSLFVFAGIWMYSSFKTGGLIEKRYANQDAMGRVKEKQFSGREEIAASEINNFLENPVFGVGVGRGSELRSQHGGEFASHNEMTRLLGEHGALGIVALLVLVITPLLLYNENRNHVMLLCFIVFWFLTINHAAMRTASAAFVYSLSLLKIIPDAKPSNPVHRQ